MQGTRGKNARIVVVEDEDLVRTMITEVLSNDGYEVEGHQDAQGAWMASGERTRTSSYWI